MLNYNQLHVCQLELSNQPNLQVLNLMCKGKIHLDSQNLNTSNSRQQSNKKYQSDTKHQTEPKKKRKMRERDERDEFIFRKQKKRLYFPPLLPSHFSDSRPITERSNIQNTQKYLFDKPKTRTRTRTKTNQTQIFLTRSMAGKPATASIHRPQEAANPAYARTQKKK